MGLDFVELVMALEDTFEVAITPADWETARVGPKLWDITAGEIHFLVGAKIHEQGRPVPPELWQQVQGVLAEVRGTRRERITPATRLGRDLRMS